MFAIIALIRWHYGGNAGEMQKEEGRMQNGCQRREGLKAVGRCDKVRFVSWSIIRLGFVYAII